VTGDPGLSPGARRSVSVLCLKPGAPIIQTPVQALVRARSVGVDSTLAARANRCVVSIQRHKEASNLGYKRGFHPVVAAKGCGFARYQ